MVRSLQSQELEDWKCYITNDLSTDGSVELVKNLIYKDDRFLLINNGTKMWQTGNYYQIVHRNEIDDQDICLTLDGDDWFPDFGVLNRVQEYYEDKKTWMTFGQFEYFVGPPGREKKGFSRKPVNFENLRNEPWTSTHLRTFKAFLLRKVKRDDLMKPDGSGFIEMAGDVACFSPCMEMAGEDRIKYVSDVNYVYNDETPLNEAKTDIRYSNKCVNLIKSRPRYERLEYV